VMGKSIVNGAVLIRQCNACNRRQRQRFINAGQFARRTFRNP